MHARGLYNHLIDIQPDLQEHSENSFYNELTKGTDTSFGIIASGIAYNYLMENYEDGGKAPKA